VVDDIDDAAAMLALEVRALGPRAEYVTDPRAAIEAARKFDPDVVLLDIGMPHINGYDLAPLLRQALAPKKISIIAVTAWGTEQDKRMSKAAGFDEHVVKPTRNGVIEEVLKRFC
jgi:CheY-like chemotaxis protein